MWTLCRKATVQKDTVQNGRSAEMGNVPIVLSLRITECHRTVVVQKWEMCLLFLVHVSQSGTGYDRVIRVKVVRVNIISPALYYTPYNKLFLLLLPIALFCKRIYLKD